MIVDFKPLLASPVDLTKLDFRDLMVSPKLDGIRAVVIDGVLLSRSLKPIPNRHVQALFSHLEYFDGELVCGDPWSPTCYRDTNSAVMSKDGAPPVTFHVFDHIEDPDADYMQRYSRLSEGPNVIVVPQIPVHTYEELMSLETELLERGYEGLMLRRGLGPLSKYKFGRATTKSGTLLKLKRFTDSEFQVVGFEERMHNANEATVDELGHTKRSSHQENKFGRGDLGALILDHPAGTFTCGTGFTDELRAAIWAERDKYLGAFAKVKHFEIGAKDKPRFPVFVGWRATEDMV